MANFDIREALKSDWVSYGVGIPVVASIYTGIGMATGLGAAAVVPLSFVASGATVGFLRKIAGWEDTPGMTKMEMTRAGQISIVSGLLVWAMGHLANVNEAAALIKGAEDAAQAAQAATPNPTVGSFLGFLSGAANFVGLMLASVFVAEYFAK